MSHANRRDIVRAIEDSMGSDGTRAAAEWVYEKLDEFAIIEYDPVRGLFIPEVFDQDETFWQDLWEQVPDELWEQ